MLGKEKRLLPVEMIPSDLWDNNTLFLPSDLVNCYQDKLIKLGLQENAIKGTDKKAIHGGCTDEETLEHFTYRYSVSSGRVVYSALSPDNSLLHLSEALLSSFSDGHVALLDIPCGHGSSALTLLTTLARLRTSGALPTLPLTVTIVGGDCSNKGLEIYESMITALIPILSACGISVNWRFIIWNATRADSTANLIDQWFDLSKGAGEYVVGITNFSGALTSVELFDGFKPSLEQILGRLHAKKSTLFWIEPASESLKDRILPKILGFFQKRIPWFSPALKGDEFVSANYKMKDPINGKIFKSGLQVHRFVRK
jgi:hypothetical protein